MSSPGPGPRFPGWLAPLIVVALLGLVGYQVIVGAEVPVWLSGLLISVVAAVIGIDVGLIGRRNGDGGR